MAEWQTLFARDEEVGTDTNALRVAAAINSTRFPVLACVRAREGKADLSFGGEWSAAILVKTTEYRGVLHTLSGDANCVLPGDEDTEEPVACMFEDWWDTVVKAAARVDTEGKAVLDGAGDESDAKDDAAETSSDGDDDERAPSPPPPPIVKGHRVALLSCGLRRGLYFSGRDGEAAAVCWDSVVVERVEPKALRGLTEAEKSEEEEDDEDDVNVVVSNVVCANVDAQDGSGSKRRPSLALLGPVAANDNWIIYRGCQSFPEGEGYAPPIIDTEGKALLGGDQRWVTVQPPIIPLTHTPKTSMAISELDAQFIAPIHGIILNKSKDTTEFQRWVLLLEPTMGVIIAPMANVCCREPPENAKLFGKAELHVALVRARCVFALTLPPPDHHSLSVQESVLAMSVATIKRRMDKAVLHLRTLAESGGNADSERGGMKTRPRVSSSVVGGDADADASDADDEGSKKPLDGVGIKTLKGSTLAELHKYCKLASLKAAPTILDCIALCMKYKGQPLTAGAIQALAEELGQTPPENGGKKGSGKSGVKGQASKTTDKITTMQGEIAAEEELARQLDSAAAKDRDTLNDLKARLKRCKNENAIRARRTEQQDDLDCGGGHTDRDRDRRDDRDRDRRDKRDRDRDRRDDHAGKRDTPKDTLEEGELKCGGGGHHSDRDRRDDRDHDHDRDRRDDRDDRRWLGRDCKGRPPRIVKA